MPPIRYWFTGQAIFLAGSFAFGIIVGLIGVKDMMPLKLFFILLAVALILTVLAWRTAATNEEQSFKMSETLNLLKSSLLSVMAYTTNLSTLSSAELKSRVSLLAAEMRIFETGINAAGNLANARPATEIDARGNSAWAARMNAWQAQRTQAQSEFRTRFLPEALAIREEMSKRLGIMSPYPDDLKAIALNYGMLAGPSPMSDAADYLEGLARQLA